MILIISNADRSQQKFFIIIIRFWAILLLTAIPSNCLGRIKRLC